MIIEYIRYQLEPERAEDFAAAYAEASAILAADEHCLDHEVAQGVEEPQNWVVRIVWDSIEGHEQGFRKSPHFRTFFSAVRPFFGDIQEMKHYRAR